MPDQTPTQSTPTPVNPAHQPTSSPVSAPSPAPAPQEFLDFGGRKVPATPETRAIYADWQNQQKTLTHAQQEIARLRQATPTPATPVEDAQKKAEQFLDRFYDDPEGTFEESLMRLIEPMLAPVKQIEAERYWNAQVEEIASKFQDFDHMAPVMAQILEQNPQLYDQPNALEIAYGLAKAQVPTTTRDPATLLADPAFRQAVLSDENLKNEIIKGYVAALAGNKTLPVTIGGQPGGSPPVAPPNAPKTLRESTRALLANLGQR
jgi:hypothetical protein